MDANTDKSETDKGSVNEKSMQSNGESEDCKEKLKEIKVEKNEPPSVQQPTKEQEKKCSGYFIICFC